MLDEIEPKFTPVVDINEMVTKRLQVPNRTRHQWIMQEDKMLDFFGMDYLHEMTHVFSMWDAKVNPLFKVEQ